MRLAVVLVLVAAAVLVTGAASAHEQGLHLVRVAHFTAPVYATAAPGQPEQLYVVEQAGRIMVLQGGHIRAAPFFDIRSLVKSGGELGLLSVAFAPDYATSHRFYVDYTDLNGDTRVVQYRSNGTSAILSSAKQLLFVKDFASNHNGGQLQFGPDGRLYWGNGDGAAPGIRNTMAKASPVRSQKIMRLNINVAAPRWQLVAYGLRNPWRFSFDRATGDLYIGDVGQDHWEEVDYLRKGSGVANFGWNHFEASHVYDASTTILTKGTYHGPIAEYSHSDGCSVTGGYVYRGSKIAAVQGRYFYGDYCSGSIWSLRVVGGKAKAVRLEPFKVAGLSSFGQDSAGELYAMSVDSGNLYRLAG